jgi:hypothetical protein
MPIVILGSEATPADGVDCIFGYKPVFYHVTRQRDAVKVADRKCSGGSGVFRRLEKIGRRPFFGLLHIPFLQPRNLISTNCYPIRGDTGC